MSRQEPKYERYVKPLSLTEMASRVYKREDNHADYKYILQSIGLFFEEAEKALENGEKIKLGEIGNITPKVHTPKNYDKEPYTELVFRRRHNNKKKMDKIFRENIKNKVYGLGAKCKCTKNQIFNLKWNGYITDEEEYVDEKNQ